MNLEKLFEELGIEKDNYEDLHITRMFSSFVAVSEGEVIAMTEPFLEYCPLAASLYRREENWSREEAIKKAVEEKISKFGSFTEKRKLYRRTIAIPYGGSEMMMYAMRKGLIDSAIIVCDGAGTVIVNRPEIVQGIGARMNGLFYTTPIPKVITELRDNGCHVVFPETAEIDQIEGLRTAIKLGNKRVAITVNACIGDSLNHIKQVERDNDVSVTSLVVCTTGIGKETIEEIGQYADVVWACASEGIRKLGEKAILQLSTAIPVFVLTEKGLSFVAGYSDDENSIRELNPEKQYLISGRYKGRKIRIGNFDSYLSETELPQRSEKEPRPLT